MHPSLRLCLPSFHGVWGALHMMNYSPNWYWLMCFTPAFICWLQQDIAQYYVRYEDNGVEYAMSVPKACVTKDKTVPSNCTPSNMLDKPSISRAGQSSMDFVSPLKLKLSRLAHGRYISSSKQCGSDNEDWLRVKIGQEPGRVKMILGKPLEIKSYDSTGQYKNSAGKTVRYGHYEEVWVYKDGASVTFVDGYVTKWSVPRAMKY